MKDVLKVKPVLFVQRQAVKVMEKVMKNWRSQECRVHYILVVDLSWWPVKGACEEYRMKIQSDDTE